MSTTYTGLEIFRRKTNFNFVGRRKGASILSAILIIGSLILLIPGVRGLNFSIDFTGGVVVEVGYPAAADLAAIRGQLSEGGFGDAQVQIFGTPQDVMIRVMPREGVENQAVANQVLDILRAAEPAVELRRTEFVGPQVGEELSEQGLLAMLFSLLMIGVYIMFRFQWRYALGAMAATLHDPIITLGFFALFQIPFDLAVLAALLAIVGYSVNDTVVILDRIRENFRKVRKATPEEIMNLSVNETLSRTIMTSLLTLLVVVAMLAFGGESLRAFSLALVVGIVVGVYSSVYIASSVALVLGASAADLIAPKVDKEGVDELP
jgi:preprotein translocase subunit SecF